MRDSNFKENKSDRADDEAAEWLIKRDRGFTAAEQDAFFVWLAADPRHGERFAEQNRRWTQFNRLVEWRPENSAEPNPDLLARTSSSKAHWRGLIPYMAAAALAVALIWSRLESPDVVEAVTQRLMADSYHRHLLPDGSLIELNQGAQAEVSYLKEERRIRLLEGEASFTVAKDENRPFIVRAAGVDVRAIGTVFNVRLATKSIEVVVTEGQVMVEDAAYGESLLAPSASGEAALVSAGQRVVLEPAPTSGVTPVNVDPEELGQLLAWRPTLLQFDARPLGELVAEFNRLNRVQVVLADPSLSAIRIVATFRSDNVEGFVRLLEQTSDVMAERGGDTITIRRKP